MTVLFACAALLFVISYLGALHPACDAFTVLRVPLAAVVLAGLAWAELRLAPLYLASALAAGAFLAWHGLGWRLWARRYALAEGTGLTLYQRNLLWWNPQRAEIIDEITRLSPDVITFQEVSTAHADLLAALAEAYPHQALCPHGRYGLAVLSRLPAGDAPILCTTPGQPSGAVALQIKRPEGAAWVISVQIHWPWPYEQGPQLAEVAPLIDALPGPKILAGDFNAMPWSHVAQRLARATGARYIGPRRQTFTRAGVPLPLDHVLAGAGQVRRLGLAGSDHRGLFARVTFPEARA